MTSLQALNDHNQWGSIPRGRRQGDRPAENGTPRPAQSWCCRLVVNLGISILDPYARMRSGYCGLKLENGMAAYISNHQNYSKAGNCSFEVDAGLAADYAASGCVAVAIEAVCSAVFSISIVV